MAKKYHVPDLSNMTPTGLVDMLADARAKMAEAKFYEEFYKEALKARWAKLDNGQEAPEMMGERFCAERSYSTQERFDVTGLRTAAANGDQTAIDVLQKYLKEVPMVQIRTEEIATPLPTPGTQAQPSIPTQSPMKTRKI